VKKKGRLSITYSSILQYSALCNLDMCWFSKIQIHTLTKIYKEETTTQKNCVLVHSL